MTDFCLNSPSNKFLASTVDYFDLPLNSPDWVPVNVIQGLTIPFKIQWNNSHHVHRINVPIDSNNGMSFSI